MKLSKQDKTQIRWAGLLVLFTLSFGGFAETFGTCCVCVQNPEGESYAISKRECKTWLRDEAKTAGCDFRQTLSWNDSLTPNEPDVSCGKVKIRGTFDSFSVSAYLPFSISKKISKNFQSQDIHYDGSSCLLFNNIDEVEDTAQRLAQKNDGVHYEISGNQNVGEVYTNLLRETREIQTSSSKVTISIQPNGEVKMSFGACSKPGEHCGYTPSDDGANNDPNSKKCTESGIVVEQSCCSTRDPKKAGRGVWGEPGHGC